MHDTLEKRRNKQEVTKKLGTLKIRQNKTQKITFHNVQADKSPKPQKRNYVYFNIWTSVHKVS